MKIKILFNFRKLSKISIQRQFVYLFVMFQLCIFTTNAYEEQTKCPGVEIAKSKKNNLGIKNCMAEFGWQELNDIPADKFICLAKCSMVKQGLIDENGQPNDENIMKSVTEYMPVDVIEKLNTLMQECLNDETTMIDPDETTCKTYIPIMLCIHSATKEACQP